MSGGLGDDGDAARYKLEPEWSSMFDDAYDMNLLGDKLIEHKGYYMSGYESQEESKRSSHFVACIRGNIK